ncbi:MAG: response regulator transcription factor [Pseudohongiellaceae bacterium]
MLVAEHDEDLNQLMGPLLEQEGFDVLLVTDGNEALKQIQKAKPDLIIIDRMIPPMGGIRICRRVRMEADMADIPIIMLNASTDVSEKILALDAGADDYLIRPFDMDELMAKIKALQRRTLAARFSSLIKAGTIEMDLDRWQVSVAGETVNLTIKEYRLLQELLEAKGRVLSRDALLERVWGHGKDLDIHTRTVDVHIGRLRSKLGESGSNIITVRNIGYRIDISLDWVRH